MSRPKYWRMKVDSASTESARMGEACDWLRAECARWPDQRQAQALLKKEADRLIGLAENLARRNR